MKAVVWIIATTLLTVPGIASAQRPTLSEGVRIYVASDSAVVAITGVTIINGK